MKLTEKLMVYKGQYGYSALLKNNDDKMYVPVTFKKGFEPNTDKAMIDIKNGFLSFFKDKNGLARTKIVVMDYTVEGDKQPEYVPFADSDVPPFTDDLPF